MKKNFYASFIALAMLLASMLPVTSFAQAKKETKAADAKAAPAVAATDPLSSLPEVDGVVSIDMQRLLNEFLPRVLASDQAKLAQVNARLDQIKTRTGLDVRSFERVAIGMHFINPTPETIQVESVALARGRFNAPVMLAAGLVTTKGKYKYREEKHGGKTIYIFNGDELYGKDDLPQAKIDEEAKKSSKAAKVADDVLQKALNFKAGEVGIVALDANTLAIGQPTMVRATIDAGAKKNAAVNAALIQLATRNPNAVLGFGVNVPANVAKYVELDMDEIAKNLNAVRQLYGSIGETAGLFGLQTIARTETAAQAQNVHDMLVGVKDLGGFFVSSLSGEKGKLAQTALDNLKITKEANEVQIKLELAQSDVAMLVRIF
jgi:hypothetical protein